MIMKKMLPALVCILILFSAANVYAEKINIVVSIYPLRDITQQVGGERVHVDFIVPPGASPHTFEPTPSDMKKITEAKIFVIIGSGLEFWAERAIRSAARKDLKVVVLSKGMPLIHESHETHAHGKAEEHHAGDTADPHIWLDPLLAKEITGRITAALIDLDPGRKAYYEKRSVEFRKELNALDARIAEAVRGFKTKEYVTFHAAWNYFSKRYGLRVAEVIEESPGKEASPKHLARIVKHIKQSGSKVVFAEPQFNPKMAEVIAREAGAQVLFLDPYGGPGIKGRDTYIGLMNYNLLTLEKAMR